MIQLPLKKMKQLLLKNKVKMNLEILNNQKIYYKIKMINHKHKITNFTAHANLQMINSHLKITEVKDILLRCIPVNTNTPHLLNMLNIHSNIMLLLLWLIILHFNNIINNLVKIHNKRNSKMKTKVLKLCLFLKFRFQRSLRSLQIFHSKVKTLIKNGKAFNNLESYKS